MMLPPFIRLWLWKKQMNRLRRSYQINGTAKNFAPKRCVLLYPADVAAWSQLVEQRTQLWPNSPLDFAFIGYTETDKEPTNVVPPYYLMHKNQLGTAYNLPENWFQSWSRQTDLLLVANPDAYPALDLLAARFPAFFRVSVYATEFGELYNFVLQSGPDAPESRLGALHVYLQKIMQL